MSAVEAAPCRACGVPKPIDSWCASEACAERVAAAQDEIRSRLFGEPTTTLTRPDATLDQLRLVIDWAKEQGLHDAEQWLRERVEAAEERMGVRR